MRDHAAQVHHGGTDETLPDDAAVGVGGHVGRRRGQPAHELVLQARAAEVGEVLQRHRRIPEDLHRLDGRQLVEEPAARGVHEQPVALQLEKPAHFQPRGRIQGQPLVAAEEGLESFRAAVEDDADVVVARLPRILEPDGRARLVERVDLVAQPVQALTQRAAPALVRLAADAAAAVAAPALHTVDAGPRGALVDLRLVRGRMGGQEGAVVGQRHVPAGLELLHRRRQRHLAEAPVVAVGLAVGRAVHQLGTLAAIGKHAAQPRGQPVAVLEQVLEGDRARDGPIVEEQRELMAAGPAPEVGAARVHAARRRRLPALGAARPHARRLVGREDGELHPGLGEHLERLGVHGRLRQPQALRLTAEARPEVREAPCHLRDLVAPAGERQDHVVVDLCDRVAVPVTRADAGPIGREDLAIDLGRLTLEPREERGPDVERDLLEVVDDVEDAIGVVHAARGRVGRVAFRRDALVPVVERRRRVLDLDGLEPGILAGRLVEVPVDGDEAARRHGVSLRPRTPRGPTGTPAGPRGERRRARRDRRSAVGGPWPGPRRSRCPRE